MLKKFLAQLEDPKHPLLGPNIWTLKIIGLLVPKNNYYKLLFLLNQLSVFVLFVFEIVDMWVSRRNLNIIMVNFKFSCLTIVNGAKVITFIFWQQKWKKIYNYVTETDIEERSSGDTVKIDIIQDCTKYCRFITYMYWILSCATTLAVVSTSPMIYIFTPDYGEKMRQGQLPFPHLIQHWFPFDASSSPQCWLVLIWHVMLICYGGWLMGTYDANMIVLMIFFENNLRMLQHQSSRIFETASDCITDEEFYNRIKDCHRKHIQLIKHARLFNSLLSPVMFLYVVICSIYISVIAIQLTLEITTIEKIINFQYLVFAVSQLFVYCYHSNKVFYKSLDVSYGPYDGDWCGSSARRLGIILFLAIQLQEKIVFTAGPFIDLTMSTFITILKGAYSYYTLLRD